MKHPSIEPAIIFQTHDERSREIGMTVFLCKSNKSKLYALGVANGQSGSAASSLINRSDLERLRDALNRELAS